MGWREAVKATQGPRPDTTPTYRVEEGGFFNYYLAHSEAEAREIHRGFAPLTPEETWVIGRVPS